MKRFVQIIMGFITAVFIICAAAALTLNADFLYQADIDRYDLVNETGMSRQEIEANYRAVVEYNNLWGPEKLEFPTLDMSDSGRIHFQEVKRVFSFIEIMALAAGIITAAAIVVSAKKKLLSYRHWAGVFTIALPAFAGIYAAVAWDSLFVTFHKLVFNNDYWIFDPVKDPVINILPDGYFLHCLIMIVLLSLSGAAAFLIWYIAGKKALKKGEACNRHPGL